MSVLSFVVKNHMKCKVMYGILCAIPSLNFFHLNIMLVKKTSLSR